MSFSAVVKEEMAGLALGNACCVLSELAGITLVSGSMHLSGGGMQAEITTESPAIAKRVYKLIKTLYGARAQIEQHERHRLNRNFSYRVALADTAIVRRMLTEIGVLGNGEVDIAIKPELVRLTCCQGAFLRGMFLGCGSMSDPSKSYQLELVVEDEQLAHSAAAMLSGADISARIAQRNNKHVVYIKEADHISDFLVMTGAHTQMLKFEGIRVEKGVRNSVNRVVNCDTANVEKSVRAAGRQLDNIRLIAKYGGLAILSVGLREAAEARLDDPDATLERLSGIMGGVSKSGLNHRFRKIEEIATEIKAREGLFDEPEEINDKQ
jgi:cell division protein WhiA